MRHVVSILAALLLTTPLWALDPTEVLSDPELESRARALDHDIRCVVCQSESAASSNAPWARDARRQIRELVVEGRSDEEIKAWFVARFGEFVLMEPPRTGSNLLLWLAGPVVLLVAGLGAFGYVRNRAKPDEADALTEEEAARLAEILKE